MFYCLGFVVDAVWHNVIVGKYLAGRPSNRWQISTYFRLSHVPETSECCLVLLSSCYVGCRHNVTGNNRDSSVTALPGCENWPKFLSLESGFFSFCGPHTISILCGGCNPAGMSGVVPPLRLYSWRGANEGQGPPCYLLTRFKVVMCVKEGSGKAVWV